MLILTTFLSICVLAVSFVSFRELRRTALQQQMYSEQTAAMIDVNNWLLEKSLEANSEMHQITEDHHEIECGTLQHIEKENTQAAEKRKQMAQQLVN